MKPPSPPQAEGPNSPQHSSLQNALNMLDQGTNPDKELNK